MSNCFSMSNKTHINKYVEKNLSNKKIGILKNIIL